MAKGSGQSAGVVAAGSGKWRNITSVSYDGINDYSEGIINNHPCQGLTSFSKLTWSFVSELTSSTYQWRQISRDTNTMRPGTQDFDIRDDDNDVKTTNPKPTIDTWIMDIQDFVVGEKYLIYRNGDNLIGTSLMTLTGPMTNSGVKMFFGAASASSGWGENKINEQYCYNRILTGAEKDELYNSGTPIDPQAHGASDALISYLRFGDGEFDTDATMFDLIFSGNNFNHNGFAVSPYFQDAPPSP